MNNDTLFRGWRIDGKGWAKGYLFMTIIDKVISASLKPCIQEIQSNGISHNSFEVMPWTVGESAGMKDDAGNVIFKGDIFSPINNKLNYVVVFEQAQFGLRNEIGYWGSLRRYKEVCEKNNIPFKVVGNCLQIEVNIKNNQNEK